MITLEHCVKLSPLSVVEPWSSKIWDSLKFEIWSGENEDFIQGSLGVIHQLTMSFIDHPHKYIAGIVEECIERMNDQRGQYLEPTGRILHAVGSSSALIFGLVVKQFLPAVFIIWQASETTAEKKRVLLLVNWILQARLDSYEVVPNPSNLLQAAEGADLFAVFQERLFEVYYGAMMDKTSLKDGSFCVTAIEGLMRLVQIPHFLSDVEKGQIFGTLSDIARDSTQDETVHDKAVLALRQISIHDPDRFKDITLAMFMSKLPNIASLDNEKRKDDFESVFFCLDALTQIACLETCKREYAGGRPHLASTDFRYRNFESMIDQLLRKLGIELRPLGDQPTRAGILGQKGQLEYVNAILATLYGGLQMFEQAIDKEDAQKESDKKNDADNKTGDVGKEPEPNALSGADELRHPYLELVQALYRRTVMRKATDAPEMPYIGLRSFSDNEDEKDIDTFVFLVGKIATLALRSSRTNTKNNFLLNRENSHPGGPSVIWTLLLDDSAAGSDLGTLQPNLQFGPAEKCLVNFLSVSLIAGLRREVCSSP
jgi:DNA repair/transcription protein MET18/MMS19